MEEKKYKEVLKDGERKKRTEGERRGKKGKDGERTRNIPNSNQRTTKIKF